MDSMPYIIDTLYALFAMTLVIFMVPGFAMLEAGIVRTKNVTAVLTINILIYAIASLAFLLFGYSLAFGDFGSDTMSKYATFLFQMAFVGKAINIISGGVSERAKVIPLTVFTVIMASFLYPLVVNITWGVNFLEGTFLELSMYDLAGSTVIHSTGGWALLAAVLIIGARHGRYTPEGGIRVFPASNVPLVTLGAFLLWIGWFGFNGGSVGSIASKENADLVALTILNTNTAGLSGAIIVAVIMQIMFKKFDITMILNGALGGLVSVTAGANLFDIYTPVLIGAIGGGLVVFSVFMFDRLRIDDPVGALSVHLVCGIWGTIAVGIFASNGQDITFFGQLKGIVVIGVFAFVSSYIVLYIINKVLPLRVKKDQEVQGLDVEECGLEAYPEFKRAFS
ncbi:ammonium transporter [Aliarcobacter cibarius]|jgi:ammonium transporter, Amt family|uniref:Ammonium transporter n=1 Tax=Aliarcobacter cibarius TaxID=255507 RepID=A0A7L5JRT5_9BACT|nr:ammonium transporter [Aliarcobacter cibarius]QKJ27921.1 ammonium transporter, marine subtype [Aliarcobacter cibarius]TLT00893.1 ammonium transporter [Aliarcobacter cibarius]TLT01463.1 ammonium transporter [Aliarcobacter cibarius]TLT02845.1 ammonium transporter [Aliarcobacter cibarius]